MQELIYLFEKFLVFISAPFIELVNISITAGWVVLAVVFIRLFLRKAPKWVSCALWGVVAVRLIFPISFESIFSLIPSTQTVNPSAIYNDSFEVNTGFSAVDSTVNSLYEGTDISAGAGVEIAGIVAFVWLAGAVIMAGYALISFLRLKLKLRTAVKKEGSIYQSESVGSPFVLGLFRPKIYLPYKTDEADIPLVVAHEKAHIRRFDHIIKPLGYLLLSVHWFNPLMWAAYILLCRDIEAACDEKVIKELGEDVRKSYSTALLNASISRRSVAACPLAFGEVGVKERIKGVMNYKKPAFWVVVAGIAVCIIAAVCLLTNPKGSEKTDYTPKISDTLDHTIALSVIENNQGKYLDGMMNFEAHKVLATKTSTDENADKIITVYIVALYEEYSVENGELVEKGGSMTPLALTFLVEEDISTGEETYALKEYWEPGMGSEYVKDLEAKFPKGVNYDTQKYVDDLQADCRSQAIEYFGLDESAITEKNTQEYTTVMVEEEKTDSEPTEVTVTTTQPIVKSKTLIVNGKVYEASEYIEFNTDSGYATVPLFIVTEALGAKVSNRNANRVTIEYNTNQNYIMDKSKNSLRSEKGGTEYLVLPPGTTHGRVCKEIKNDYVVDNDTLRHFLLTQFGARISVDAKTQTVIINTEKETNGVTANIGLDAQPQLTGKVKSATDKVIYMELESDQSGIKKGTPVTVRLSKMLSYALEIDTSKLKRGDVVTVIYDGRVMETYPLQIDAYAVYKIAT